MGYNFSKEKVVFRLSHKKLIINWLDSLIKKERAKRGDISYIFCTDKYLLNMNKAYLNHDFYTDVITFDYSEHKLISGDIFISIDRVKDNAKQFNVSFQNELLRVIVHGVLHLCGYNDKTKAQEKQMRAKEDYYLSLFPKSK
jgi:probable rRNA maturation factor